MAGQKWGAAKEKKENNKIIEVEGSEAAKQKIEENKVRRARERGGVLEREKGLPFGQFAERKERAAFAAQGKKADSCHYSVSGKKQGGGSCLWAARRDAGREIAALWQRGQRDRGGRRDAALAA
ncbi:hypothetical protein ACFX1Q_023976 [Malus domestica]